MAQDDIQRTLGRIEQGLSGQGRELGEIKDWQVRHDEAHVREHQEFVDWRTTHEENHHGSHGRRFLNKANAAGGGIGLLALAELWRIVMDLT